MEDLKGQLHSLSVENARKICVTAVCEVESITTECVKLTLIGGKRMQINGQNLKMGAFSKQNSTFWAEGSIVEIKYLTGKTSFIKKLLK